MFFLFSHYLSSIKRFGSWKLVLWSPGNLTSFKICRYALNVMLRVKPMLNQCCDTWLLKLFLSLIFLVYHRIPFQSRLAYHFWKWMNSVIDLIELNINSISVCTHCQLGTTGHFSCEYVCWSENHNDWFYSLIILSQPFWGEHCC